MKIAFFSAHSYDRQYFTKYNIGYELVFLDVKLNMESYQLAAGSEVVCAFVNDVLDREVLQALST
ncbi:MAG TPA: hypothetical protein VLC28_12315, partial [Flavitalea sp.]|nr:hypothetical protein [Flavitalea sp.]